MLLFVALFLFVPSAHAAEKTNLPPAELGIDGYGLLGDMRLKRIVKLLEFQKRKPRFFDANFLEDTALILMSKLRDDGYLEPVITAHVTLDDGREMEFVWDEAVEDPLPRPLRARKALFQIERGVLYHYKEIRFEGLDAIPEKRARSYFIETSGVIPMKTSRVYSPDRFKRSLANIKESLERMGYQDAEVTVGRLDRDDETGEISVDVRVKQGSQFVVRSVRQEVAYGLTNAPSETLTNYLLHPYSKLWEQDFIHGIKTNYYHQGYPETTVAMQTMEREPGNKLLLLDLLAKVQTGPQVRVGDIAFKGNQRTREALLDRRVPLDEGDLLNRVKAERGQYRLSRLGVFDTVDLNYTPSVSNVWDVLYELDEGRRIDVSLIFGFGSYDLLRGGVEVNQYNLWGLAHSQRLRLVQSFKSSSGDYTYTVPGLIGEDVDLFVNGSVLRREEVSFTRFEYGGGTGVRKFFQGIATDVTFRYNYGILEATETSINFMDQGAQSPTVGELIAELRHDRRDNPLNPQKGYQINTSFEFASEYLGGDVNFQRFEVGGSYHLPLNDSEWIHLGLKHGIVSPIGGGSSNNLPITRRFFPGGENSVRGFSEGEASPRNVEGQIVGAETYIGGNFEFEQALTPKWSLVAFVDGVGFARTMDGYPVDEALFSAGGGLRWKTLIGPVRIEYGHNLNPRARDPAGTVHFSLGFPF